MKLTIWNKGKRVWNLKNADGEIEKVEPDAAIIMDEADALRMLKDYPRDWAEGGKSKGRSAAELARWEQSLKDREKNLEKREKELSEKEQDPDGGKPKGKRGRPAAPSEGE